MNPDLDTLVTSLYVTVDDLLIENPHWAPQRPVVNIPPKLSDAELITLAVIGALLRIESEARFIRLRQNASATLVSLYSHPVSLQQATAPQHPDDAKRNGLFVPGHPLLARRPVDTGLHPGRMRPQPPNPTTLRPDKAGPKRGYCASHSRYFWGLPLHLVATPSGLPIAWALAPAKADQPRDRLGHAVPKRPRTGRADHHRRQRLPTEKFREHSQPGRHHPYPACHQNRKAPARTTVPCAPSARS